MTPRFIVHCVSLFVHRITTYDTHEKFVIMLFYYITFDFLFHYFVLITCSIWLVNSVQINVSHYHVQLLFVTYHYFMYEETKAQRIYLLDQDGDIKILVKEILLKNLHS